MDYVRDRPREFAEAARPTKQEVLKKFDAAVETVLGFSLEKGHAAADWSAKYVAEGADAKDRFEMVLQCATHLHHHIGQMMYLTFELKKNA